MGPQPQRHASMTLKEEVELLRQKRDLLKELVALDRQLSVRTLAIAPILKSLLPTCPWS